MGRPQVNIRVDEGQKEEWEEYVADSAQYGSVSALIRTAVAREMAGQYDPSPSSDSSEGTETAVESSGEVLTALNRLEGKMDDLSDEITVVKNEAAGGEVIEEELKAIKQGLPIDEEDAFTAPELAERIGKAPSIEESLEQLTAAESVHKTEDGKYWRDEEWTLAEVDSDES